MPKLKTIATVATVLKFGHSMHTVYLGGFRARH